jgi:hypothetical protein
LKYQKTCQRSSLFSSSTNHYSGTRRNSSLTKLARRETRSSV